MSEMIGVILEEPDGSTALKPIPPTSPSVIIVNLDGSDTVKHFPAVEVIESVPIDIEEQKDDDQSVCHSLSASVASRVFHVSWTVRVGSFILSFCAGMVNIMAFRIFSVFVSHLTGTVSKIGMGMEDSDAFDPGEMGMLVVSFVIGSALTGFMIAKDTIHFGMALYDLCLMTESGLLIAAALAHDMKFARYFTATACGLQNGMATHWGGAVIRTTHVTGLLTDVGLLIGRLLSLCCRKRCGRRFDNFDRAFFEDDISKLSVLAVIFIAFLAGAFSGAHLYNAMEHLALLVPAVILGVIGVTYSTYRVVVLRQSFFSDAEMEAIDVPLEVHEGYEEFKKRKSSSMVVDDPSPRPSGEVQQDVTAVKSEVFSKSATHNSARSKRSNRSNRLPSVLSRKGSSRHLQRSGSTVSLSRNGSTGEVVSISRRTAEELENSQYGCGP